jgi:hypothetical protein
VHYDCIILFELQLVHNLKTKYLKFVIYFLSPNYMTKSHECSKDAVRSSVPLNSYFVHVTFSSLPVIVYVQLFYIHSTFTLHLQFLLALVKLIHF